MRERRTTRVRSNCGRGQGWISFGPREKEDKMEETRDGKGERPEMIRREKMREGKSEWWK